MIAPEKPADENLRLNALQSYQILDSFSEQDYDDITLMASELCQTPISVISLVDSSRQWFKSKYGLAASETSRDVSFCGHAILQPNEIMVVNDARSDERFFDNPLVTGNPNIVFYAGIPLVDEQGFALGTLCTIDNKPRQLTANQLKALKVLSRNVLLLLNNRKKNRQLELSNNYLFDCINFSAPFFLRIDIEGRFLNIGENFFRAVPFLEVNALFSDFFTWLSPFNASALLDGSNRHTKLLFFSTLSTQQKFKCSVFRYDERSYFVFASPIINTALPIVNYNITLNNFPKQDYVAEYLFLQQAASKGLEDSQKLNSLLKEKNKQLEVSQHQLLNSNAQLEERISERTAEIKNLALFPEQNPNPVFELDYLKRKINYMNPAAKVKFANDVFLNFETLLELFTISASDIQTKNTAKKEFELSDKYYEINTFFISDNHIMRLYLHDITEIKHNQIKEKQKNEAFIRQQSALLQMRSISNELSLDDKLKLICKLTAGVLASSRCSIWLFNSDNSAINTNFIYSLADNQYLDGASIWAKDVPAYFNALNQKVIIEATHATTHEATAEFTESYLKPLNIVSMLDIPLIQSEKSMGVICNEYVAENKYFTEQDISFAHSVSDVIVLAFESEQLKKSQLQLQESNQSLNEAMQRLMAMQDDIIQQEKLATLGMLIAGIAHEINTPLGAIKASTENLQQGLINQIIDKINHSPAELIKKGIDLLGMSKPGINNYSTKEERLLIKGIEQELNQHFNALENKNYYARKIMELGFDKLETPWINFINQPQSQEIFSIACDFNKLYKSLQTIGLAVDKASKVVKALNTFSHGNIDNEITDFNLFENIEAVVTLLWNKIKYSASVINNIDKNLFIRGNAEELSQVWTNIINNALQASNNRCTIYIDYNNLDQHHQICIANNGPAIPADALPKIFDAFYSTKKRGEGTGLGLNIVKNIVEKHQGTITCSSSDEKTTFCITINKTI